MTHATGTTLEQLHAALDRLQEQADKRVVAIFKDGTTLELPPYLRRGPDGCLELVLHPTQGQQWNVCQMKHQLRYGWSIERAQPRPALNYGGGLHEALAYRYKHSPATLDPAIEPAQMQLLETWFADKPQAPDEWRNLGRAQQAIAAYNEHYPGESWQVLAVEEEFERVVGLLADGTRVILKGRKDLAIAQNRELWVVDHKTASEWGEDPEKNQSVLGDRRSFQFRAYTWEERERQLEWRNEQAYAVRALNDIPAANPPIRMVASVRGVLANYLVGRRNFSDNPAFASRRSANAKPRDEFVRWPYPYSDAALDEWQEECLALAGEIISAWRKGYWRQAFDRSCAHYGRCEFYDYCDADPSDRESVLSGSLYRGRTVEGAVAEPETET